MCFSHPPRAGRTDRWQIARFMAFAPSVPVGGTASELVKPRLGAAGPNGSIRPATIPTARREPVPGVPVEDEAEIRLAARPDLARTPRFRASPAGAASSG